MSTDEFVEPDIVTGYVRGSLFKSYSMYCPLVSAWGYAQNNGKILLDIGTDEQVEVDPESILPVFGILIVHLGGIERDLTLETAATALYHSLESLFSACNDSVSIERFRTTVELSEFMKVYRCNYSHIVIVGHGSSEGIGFLDKPGPIAGTEIGGLLGADSHTNPITIISLCCHSGCTKLSSSLSTSKSVSEVIAPSETFDLRWSVYYITGLFLSLYITGDSVDSAVKKANEQTDGGDMCVWRSGFISGWCSDKNVLTEQPF